MISDTVSPFRDDGRWFDCRTHVDFFMGMKSEIHDTGELQQHDPQEHQRFPATVSRRCESTEKTSTPYITLKT